MIRPPRVALTGVGYAVPPSIRTNDDPIFDWLKAHQTAGQDLFQGYKERRVARLRRRPVGPADDGRRPDGPRRAVRRSRRRASSPARLTRSSATRQ